MKLQPELIEPHGACVSAIEAKSFLRKYLVTTLGMSKTRVAGHISSFSEELKFHLEELRGEVTDAKESAREDLADLKERLSAKRKELVLETKQEQRERLTWDIEALIEEINEAKEYGRDSVEEAKAAVAAFIEDKREFVCQYINREVLRNATDA